MVLLYLQTPLLGDKSDLGMEGIGQNVFHLEEQDKTDIQPFVKGLIKDLA